MSLLRRIGVAGLRRLPGAVAVLFVLSIAVFVMQDAAPGSVEQTLRPVGLPATPELIQSIRQEYHLNDPLPVRYVKWLGDAVQLDFGKSVRTGEPVTDVLRAHAGISVELGVATFLLTIFVGIPLGVLAGLRRRTAVDRLVVSASVVGASTPAFLMAIVLIYLFALVAKWFPAVGPGDGGVLDRVQHLVLPVVALTATAVALIVKLTRAAVIESHSQDYVTFARARGLPYQQVVRNYVVRNALIPILTAGGIVLGYVLTGAVLVEVAFALPGLGALLVDSAAKQDIPVIQALTLLFAAVIIAVNFLTDVLYAVVDPRIEIS
jgi:peptide/nickel transport system permease protein